MRKLMFILGGVLAIYAAAGVVFETWYADDEQVEATLCRVFLCRSTPLLSRARQRLSEPSDENLPLALADFRRALQRNAHDPYRWQDLGRAFLLAGRPVEARYCFEQVLALAPYRPALLLGVANFHFQLGETTAALPITARILQAIPDYDPVIFSQYTRLVDRVDDVLRYGLPEEARPAQSWLRFLIGHGRLADARQTWNWLASRRLTDDALAGEYTQFLLDQHQVAPAAPSWAAYLGSRTGDYRQSNYLFNGGFELEPTGAPLDWRFGSAEGVEVERDSSVFSSGRWSLRLSFLGTANLNSGGVSQLACVDPGAYLFQAFVRTEGLTTDEGIRLRIMDVEAPGRFNVETAPFLGTNAWTKVESQFHIPQGTRLVRFEVIRRPSLKFDSKIRGTVWLDTVQLQLRSRAE